MATRSRIRMVLPTGEAKSIYCHYDGYPSNQAPILKEHYNTTEKVRELLELGAISYLAPRVKPEPGEEHSFEMPADDVVVAYHRDRGEELHTGHDDPEEYDYVWDGEAWYLSDERGKTKL